VPAHFRLTIQSAAGYPCSIAREPKHPTGGQVYLGIRGKAKGLGGLTKPTVCGTTGRTVHSWPSRCAIRTTRLSHSQAKQCLPTHFFALVPDKSKVAQTRQAQKWE